MGIEITKQMIAEYKKLTGNNFLPDFIVSKLINDAIESGEIPEGFEKLVNDVQTNEKSAKSTNLFGYGFDDGFVSQEEGLYYKTNPNNINNQDVRANSNQENTSTVHKNVSDENTGNDIGFSTNKIVYSENLIRAYVRKNVHTF